MDTVIRQAVWIRNPRRILRCARIQRPWQMKPTPNAERDAGRSSQAIDKASKHPCSIIMVMPLLHVAGVGSRMKRDLQ